MPAREELVSQEEISHSSDNLSAHLAGESRVGRDHILAGVA